MRFLLLEEIDSTNSYVSLHAEELEDMTMVMASRQTAGRGQRGNTWESEPGKNLTFTMLWKRPEVEACRQFAISEATALAMLDVLEEAGIAAKVKWPNDIYVDDRKICGILIEHALLGSRIEHTRIGAGLNVNQREFRSDAPNPVSMAQFTSREYDISRVAASVGQALSARLGSACTPGGRASLHEEFFGRMWRAEGVHMFRRRDTGRLFRGRIAGVLPEGPIEIEDIDQNTLNQFAFKEVEFVVGDSSSALPK